MSLRSVNGWLTILSRINANFKTGLTAPDYVSGFGDIMTNYWLGLSHINQLTGTAVNGGHTYRLRVELLLVQDNR